MTVLLISSSERSNSDATKVTEDVFKVYRTMKTVSDLALINIHGPQMDTSKRKMEVAGKAYRH